MLMPNTKIQEGDSFSGFMEMSDVKTWNGQIQELKGGFNRGYGEVIELPTESPTPLLHCHTPQTTATMRVYAGRASAPEPKMAINSVILLRK